MADYLPLGTVVKLYDDDKLLMIYGRAQVIPEKGCVYDYIACEYPVGLLNSQEGYMFNSNAIQSVFYIGFQDADELNYRQALKKYVETHVEDIQF